MKKIIPLLILIVGLGSNIIFTSCNETGTVQAPGTVTKRLFGQLPGAAEVNLYTLAQNNGVNHLHGGLKGFDKVVWQAEDFSFGNSVGLKLHYLSKDGEEGYPGNLSIDITYTLTGKYGRVYTQYSA